MNSQRDLFRVTCKCALFSLDGKKVLLADYGKEGFGLPGGHMDLNETPDEAVRRELREELGIEGVQLKRRDFFLHPNGKVVLGYTAKIDETTKFKIQTEEVCGVTWRLVTSIENGEIKVPSYGKFILAHRP